MCPGVCVCVCVCVCVLEGGTFKVIQVLQSAIFQLNKSIYKFNRVNFCLKLTTH